MSCRLLVEQLEDSSVISKRDITVTMVTATWNPADVSAECFDLSAVWFGTLAFC
jgi:hypothetical protein